MDKYKKHSGDISLNRIEQKQISDQHFCFTLLFTTSSRLSIKGNNLVCSQNENGNLNWVGT